MKILIALILFVISVVGYIANVVGLAHHVGFGVLEVMRIAGIFFPPLGIIMGYV